MKKDLLETLKDTTESKSLITYEKWIGGVQTIFRKKWLKVDENFQKYSQTIQANVYHANTFYYRFTMQNRRT